MALVGFFAPNQIAVQQVVAESRAAKQAARRADDLAIRASAQKLPAAFQTGDTAAISVLFTDEAEGPPKGREPIGGRDACGKLSSKWQELKAEATSNMVRLIAVFAALEAATFTATAKRGPTNTVVPAHT